MSRLLVAPERREHIERTAVDVDASSAHASCDTPCARLIVRPHRARETIYAVVCDAHSVIFVRVRENAHYRSKDFLLGDCHVRRHSTEHGRFYKVPFRKLRGRIRSAQQQFRPFGDSFFNIDAYAITLRVRDQRPEFRIRR